MITGNYNLIFLKSPAFDILFDSSFFIFLMFDVAIYQKILSATLSITASIRPSPSTSSATASVQPAITSLLDECISFMHS